MLVKILKKEFHRNKIITIVLLSFISLSALLVSSGSSLMIKMIYSMENLFIKSDIPHFVQMHAGLLEQSDIETWASNNSLVQKQQTVEMANIDGKHLFLGNSDRKEINSVMDISFVKQNRSFDFLLDLDNQVIEVSRGEIGVPIYYMQKNQLQIGDKVKISNGAYEIEFIVSAFIRDALMNPSIVHSKRFLVHEVDFEFLKKNIAEMEYLIEFQLDDLSKLSEFSHAYEASNLPNQGPAIDYHTFKILNALTDGIIVAVIIMVSVLLIIIALLCLRLTILATIEEDYREIGVMKAIGIETNDIKRIYLVKYIVITAFSSAIGYLVSLFLSPIFTSNLMLFFGPGAKNMLEYILPLIAIGCIVLFIIFFCQLTFNRLNNITAVEALRTGSNRENKRRKSHFTLQRNSYFNVNIYLGIKDIFERLKMYGLLFLVFIFCTFVIIVPVNFLNTIQSPSFISYMGIGQSDLRIDLQQSDNIVQRFNNALSYIENDPDVQQFAPTVTSRLKVVGRDRALENINVEMGDLSVFPLLYLKGVSPTRDNEIALSYLNGKELELGVGDTLRLVLRGEEKEMVVSGIYQDVTNGGRTAKALLPISHENVLWYVINLDVKPHIKISEKIEEYSEVFHPAKVTHLQGYLSETLGETVKKLRLLTIIAIGIGVFVAILITALFVKVLIAKDSSQIAIMRSIGFSLKDIQVQYVSKVLGVMVGAIIFGTVFSNTIGQSMISVLWTFLGAAKIDFVIDPVRAYIFCPLLLLSCVTIATLLSTASISNSNIAQMNAE